MNVTTINSLLLTAFSEVDHGVVGSQSSTSSPLLRQGLSLVSATVLHTLGWVTLEFLAHFSVFQINVGVSGLQMWVPHLTGYMASGPRTQVMRLVRKALSPTKPSPWP